MSDLMRGRKIQSLATLSAVVLVMGTLAGQQSVPPSQPGGLKKVWDGVFTSEQAARGKAGYEGVCARCHGVPLTGGGADEGPPLKGSGFLSHWHNDTLASLYTKIRDTMPRTTPGTISDEVKIEILAYLLQQNGFPAGAAELTRDLPTLDSVRIVQRGVWDGIFSPAQAERGRASAAQGRCTGCHGSELGGTDRAPALKGPAFLANWEDGSVNRLFAKIRDTMPPSNTDQLAAATKLDVVAFILLENGFPPGPVELPSDVDALDTIQIVKKALDAGGAPNFALVQVVGCLSRDASSGWTLTNAAEPLVTRDDVPSAAALRSAESKALGSQTLHLVSVGSRKMDEMNGRKIEARGLLYREGAYADLNLTSLQPVAPTCSK
jgi:S-disulfanyl-L-cysteine oxidoreductase SoxD